SRLSISALAASIPRQKGPSKMLVSALVTTILAGKSRRNYLKYLVVRIGRFPEHVIGIGGVAQNDGEDRDCAIQHEELRLRRSGSLPDGDVGRDDVGEQAHREPGVAKHEQHCAQDEGQIALAPLERPPYPDHSRRSGKRHWAQHHDMRRLEPARSDLG